MKNRRSTVSDFLFDMGRCCRFLDPSEGRRNCHCPASYIVSVALSPTTVFLSLAFSITSFSWSSGFGLAGFIFCPSSTRPRGAVERDWPSITAGEENRRLLRRYLLQQTTQAGKVVYLSPLPVHLSTHIASPLYVSFSLYAGADENKGSGPSLSLGTVPEKVNNFFFPSPCQSQIPSWVYVSEENNNVNGGSQRSSSSSSSLYLQSQALFCNAEADGTHAAAEANLLQLGHGLLEMDFL